MTANEADVERCARLVQDADGILITAGAGMGVDSGLPDFRGEGGFWKHYPGLAAAGLQFEEIANPRHFDTDPQLAWGFYGHRLNLYRATQPHDGFRLLRELGERMPARYFVYTSNVDGHFQKAGFDPARLVECHGSIEHMQCQAGCSAEIWPAPPKAPIIDEARCRLMSDIPTCPKCGAVARPNILMFGDAKWIAHRSRIQQLRFHAWRKQVRRPVVIELGAGVAVPTVRLFGMGQDAPLIRIDPAECDWPSDAVLKLGALAGVQALCRALEKTV
ncbi:MAG: Sir2 family NAD-dependent protein deacetylase [Candidatus Accumulibacter sp. UW25]|jgi:NAD-dependent SIR2 family protein deacetylase